MNAAYKTITSLLAASLVLAATACKNDASPKETPTAPDGPLINEGIVFREGFSEQTIPGRIQGDWPASELRKDCVGLLTSEPTADVRFEDVPARVHVVADIDTVLVMDGPDGVLCNDNFDGENPSLAQHWAAGQYKIYVGSAEQTEGPFDYDLNFDHYDPRYPLEPTPIPEAPVMDAAEQDDADAADDTQAPANEGE